MAVINGLFGPLLSAPRAIPGGTLGTIPPGGIQQIPTQVMPLPYQDPYAQMQAQQLQKMHALTQTAQMQAQLGLAQAQLGSQSLQGLQQAQTGNFPRIATEQIQGGMLLPVKPYAGDTVTLFFDGEKWVNGVDQIKRAKLLNNNGGFSLDELQDASEFIDKIEEEQHAGSPQ